MHYTAKALKEIENAVSELRFRHIKVVEVVSIFGNKLRSDRAKEYMTNGVLRRLFILYRCIENIFRLFPANRAEKLTDEERYDLEINLHCFLINIYGISENLGLSMAFVNGLIGEGVSERSKRNEIGLFNSKFRKIVNPILRKYLDESKIADWYNEYAKSYRDALTHRIPPYVPPSGLNNEEQKEFAALNDRLSNLSKNAYSEKYSQIIDKMYNLDKASPFYTHSFSEKAKLVYLHPQIIADFRTVEELINIATSNFIFNEDHNYQQPGI